MIHIFKTSVTSKETVKEIAAQLNAFLGNNALWNFDLEDCDNILRVAGSKRAPEQIIDFLHNLQIECAEL